MKATLLNALHTRFDGIESNRLYSMATLLDERFKQRFLTEAACTEAKAGVIVTATTLSTSQTQSQNAPAESETQSATATDEDVQPLPKKRCIAESSSTSKLWNCFEELLQEDTVSASSSMAITVQDIISKELSTHLGEPLVQRNDDPAVCVVEYNASRFPILAKVAQMYLAPPPTSVPSERLFMWLGTSLAKIVHASTQTMLKN